MPRVNRTRRASSNGMTEAEYDLLLVGTGMNSYSQEQIAEIFRRCGDAARERCQREFGLDEKLFINAWPAPTKK